MGSKVMLKFSHSFLEIVILSFKMPIILYLNILFSLEIFLISDNSGLSLFQFALQFRNVWFLDGNSWPTAINFTLFRLDQIVEFLNLMNEGFRISCEGFIAKIPNSSFKVINLWLEIVNIVVLLQQGSIQLLFLVQNHLELVFHLFEFLMFIGNSLQVN